MQKILFAAVMATLLSCQKETSCEGFNCSMIDTAFLIDTMYINNETAPDEILLQRGIYNDRPDAFSFGTFDSTGKLQWATSQSPYAYGDVMHVLVDENEKGSFEIWQTGGFGNAQNADSILVQWFKRFPDGGPPLYQVTVAKNQRFAVMPDSLLHAGIHGHDLQTIRFLDP